MIIMKILWVLIVVAAQVFAKPIQTSRCVFYCNILYSGWQLLFTRQCHCFLLKPEVQYNFANGQIQELYQTKFNNREYKYSTHNSDRNKKVKLHYENLSQKPISIDDLDNNKTDHTVKYKIKRTSLHMKKYSTVKREYTENIDNDNNVNEDNLSSCINLHITQNKRNQNKSNLKDFEKIDQKQFGNFGNDEVHREIARNCEEAITILQRSVAEIKNNLITKLKINKFYDKRKPQTDSTTVSYHSELIFTRDGINPNNPIDTLYYNENNKTITTTEIKSIKEIKNSEDSELKEANRIEDGADGNTIESNTFKNKILKVTDVTLNISHTDMLNRNESENISSTKNYDLSTKIQNTHKILTDFAAKENQTFNSVNTFSLNDLKVKEKYNESKSSILTLITQNIYKETVPNFMNVTEILPNPIFEKVTEKTELETEKLTTSTPDSFKKQSFFNISPVSLTGRLYFVNGEKHIPGYFVQTPKGQLGLGVDMKYLCSNIIPEDDWKSLITTLCHILHNKQ